MTLTLLPAVDVQDGTAVRLVQGAAGSETSYGDPLEAALTWQRDGAEWIHLVDLDAAFGRGSNHELLAEVIGKHFPSNVASFLADNALDLGDVDTWFAHPGGPRILEAFADSLRLPDDALALSYESLARVGNLSSASVLHVLASGFEQDAGSHGLLFAVGPGVSAEFVLLEWRA